jgi:hypothetical protein
VVIGHQVEIETVPQRVARAALQLDETGVNGSSFHAQTGQFRQNERGSRPVRDRPDHPLRPAVITERVVTVSLLTILNESESTACTPNAARYPRVRT